MTLSDLLDLHQVRVYCKFVPQSRARKSWAEGRDEVHWEATVEVRGWHVLTTPYSTGVGHLRFDVPGHVPPQYAIEEAVEHGSSLCLGGTLWAKEPSREQVMSALLWDCEVLDYDRLADWASDNGYTPVTDQVREAWRLMRKNGRSLRRALGSAVDEMRYVNKETS